MMQIFSCIFFFYVFSSFQKNNWQILIYLCRGNIKEWEFSAPFVSKGYIFKVNTVRIEYLLYLCISTSKYQTGDWELIRNWNWPKKTDFYHLNINLKKSQIQKWKKTFLNPYKTFTTKGFLYVKFQVLGTINRSPGPSLEILRTKH